MKWILIVDDEVSIRESLAALLESRQIGVVSASSFGEAQKLMNIYRFDLVVTDLRLTGTDRKEGLDLISRIKQEAPNTTVVLMTAFGSPEVESEARMRGASDYWTKSISIPEMLSRIRKLGIPVGQPNGA